MTILLTRYSEIGLKSTHVRRRFERQLEDNIISMLMEDGVEAIVTKKKSRIYIESNDINSAIRSIKRVFGVGSLSIAEICSSRIEDIVSYVTQYSKDVLIYNQSFAVRTRREKSYKHTSMDINKQVGSSILIANKDKNVKVDLTNPNITFYIEILGNLAYVFLRYIKCHAGLPVGSQGNVFAILDNKRDMVAAWLMMKRGCRIITKESIYTRSLRQYDPYIVITDHDSYSKYNILGYVTGISLGDLDSIDVSKYEFPVYFPLMGMTDQEVHRLVDIITSGS